ncbi:hypothetical protein J3459_018377 [Metarhizium acridum]|uniref:uncharacterized protein n=1 Tax=Metarhizium acridum TaxID=92637 RepID=UPI001C6C1C02|nr:hypothetical protein J3459_018377 [Metarhizium acridum]KAG8411867.1 hypothetical protein J3458_015162 [Metarhizium acridum]
MSNTVRMRREWHGSALPSHVTIPLPSPAELVRLCTKSHPLGYTIGMPYPDADSPVFWIKYRSKLVWNELAAQKMAHDGLRELNSPVKAPAVYYGCQVTVHKDDAHAWQSRTYFVMEYISGKTAAQRLEEATDDATKDDIYKQIALALSELHRIPVPQDSRPAAVNGETIRHVLFYDNEASIHYRNVTELEEHFNAFLTLTKRKHRVKNLAQEPMVFCYSDIWLGNFILDDEGRITVVDFEDASILPSSFSKLVLAGTWEKIDRDIRHMVVVPQAKDIDNTRALVAISYPIQVCGGFANAGRKILGYYEIEEADKVDKVVTDEQGQPLSAPAMTKLTLELRRPIAVEGLPPPPPEPRHRPYTPPPIDPAWEQKWLQYFGGGHVAQASSESQSGPKRA